MLEILNATDVIKSGHFQLSSGKHSDKYVEKRNLYLHTQETIELRKMMADGFRNKNIDVVVGPERGGLILAFLVVNALSRMDGKDIIDIFAQKNLNGFEFYNGQGCLIQHKNVLIVDDVLTTGESVKKVISAVKSQGGRILGLSVICNRGGISAGGVGVLEPQSLITLGLNAWKNSDCPMCIIHGREDLQVT